MQRIVIDQSFPFSVERLFGDLADHENLGRILGAPIKRVVDGEGPGGVNGVGSVRRLGSGPVAFEETVVTCIPNELIEYRVTKGSPIKNHLGRMEFTGDGDRSHLHYVITFEGKLPLLGAIIRPILRSSAARGLAKHARQ